LTGIGPANGKNDRTRLEQKYHEELEKRLRSGRFGHYTAVEGRYSRFAADPSGGEPLPRPVSHDPVDVVVVGGGLSGLLTAVELRRAGIDDFRIVDTGADFGGTWYWNRYPGLRCDVESYIYLPLLEETGYVPTEKYAGGAEIQAYIRTIANRYHLYDNALLHTQVIDARWSPEDTRWVVRTDRGDELRARFVVLGSGPLNRPKLPGVPGIDEFQGVQFHSSRWNYDYTGGDAHGGMTKLRDKRVAVVGTGTSAAQIVPAVARDAQHLYVVQRTPSIVDSRDNAPTDQDWFTGQPAGWQQKRMENFDSILAGIRQDKDLVGDKWTSIWGGIADAMSEGTIEGAMARLADMDLAELGRIRARIDEQVGDPKTAAALKPYYSRFCKRPCFNDDYLPTFNRTNVTLIDTQGRGLDRISRDGIVFDGAEYPVDLIIYATGFEFGVAPTRSGGFEVHGRNGMTLTEHRAREVRSLHGIQFRGFPNLFVIGGLHQAAVSINAPLVFHYQAHHVASVMRSLLDRGIRAADVTVEAVASWSDVITARSTFSVDTARNCTPGWANNDGSYEPGQPNAFANAFGGGPFEYATVLQGWRDGSFEQDLTVEFAPKETAGGGAR
jgi:cyclohexanone monooxygenase